MPNVQLTQGLRQEYVSLFNSCLIRPERAKEVDRIVAKLAANRTRYDEAAGKAGVPWSFVAVVHNMEASLNFSTHLHNGDPLLRRTVQVPKGRPLAGNPPFTWEVSAADALGLKGLGKGTDWSLAGTLYQIERYNGWGYRLYHTHVLSPYLWSASTHYISGKYVADGTWSDTAKSAQLGAAVLLRRMSENGDIEFRDQPAPTPDTGPMVVSYATRKPTDPATIQRAIELQTWLNHFPGVFVKIDGYPGKRTSEAYQKITGHYLPGDPRA
ncbi:MAG TPA: hypothetical protein VLI06_10245 [Solimonas sp.]|nr:hypothetical protein [Solimonas sp.]